MDKGHLYIVSAPSGAGKTSLLRSLSAQLEGLVISVSHTTRVMRPGEVDGTDYHFVDTAEFESMIERDGFLEYAQVFDHYYGTAQSSVEAMMASGKDVILEIDWQGAQQVRDKLPESVSVFILPPSKQVLQQRLSDRGQDSSKIIARRMADAVSEMSHYAEYDYLIINDDFDNAVGEFAMIVGSNRLSLDIQRQKQENLIKSLLA